MSAGGTVRVVSLGQRAPVLFGRVPVRARSLWPWGLEPLWQVPAGVRLGGGVDAMGELCCLDEG